MTCNRNCDCVGECKAGNDKPTTPTPGDLSARLREGCALDTTLNAEQALGDGVLELFLCETKRVLLKPQRLYRFSIDPNCAHCALLAAEQSA